VIPEGHFGNQTKFRVMFSEALVYTLVRIKVTCMTVTDHYFPMFSLITELARHVLIMRLGETTENLSHDHIRVRVPMLD
jgi:hypothetical protein